MITKYKIFENSNDPENLIGLRASLIKSGIKLYDRSGTYFGQSCLKVGKSRVIYDVKKVNNLILIGFGRASDCDVGYYNINDFQIIEQKFTENDPYGEEDWES